MPALFTFLSQRFAEHRFLYVLIILMSIGSGFLKLLSDQANQDVSIYIAKSNNLWVYHGSKSIKSKLYELERNHLALELSRLHKSEVEPGLMTAALANLDREITRYKREQADIQAQAIRYDLAFEISQRKSLIIKSAFLMSVVSIFSLLLMVFLGIRYLAPVLISLLLFIGASGLGLYGYSCHQCFNLQIRTVTEEDTQLN
ncbi:MAG: DUF4337 family protein [Candidatus Caenarcaniphilales bacterium]|nr:DUF4337 family protein [Candidatus Caenarcaniphilales bacterium]